MIANQQLRDLVDELGKAADARQANRDLRDRYYEGDVQLARLGVNIPPELNRFRTVINFPRIYIDALEERMDIEGFRLAGQEQTSDELWSVWQANNLDDESHLTHLEALIQKRAYVVVGPSDDSEFPVITAHPAEGWEVRVDPVTRRLTVAFQKWVDAEETARACLYLPEKTVSLVEEYGQWAVEDEFVHALGVVPVVPMVNRARLGDTRGRSEMSDVLALTDAAARALTNLQMAGETLALPQRFVLGASQEDFVDADGNRVPKWQAYFNNLFAMENQEAKVLQLPGADLRNFHETINTYATAVSAVTGLPPHYLGLTSDNPASADAIRSSESRLVKKVERKNRAFGESWERALRIALLLMGRDVNAERIETVWRDPSTPTTAQMVDAVAKLRAAGADGRPLVSDDTGRAMIGMSAEARKREAELLRDPTMAASGLE